MPAVPRPVPASAILDHVRSHTDVIVSLAAGEPKTVVDALCDGGDAFEDVQIHQMHAIHDRPYLHGKVPGLRHIAYFLGAASRAGLREGTVDVIPAHFSEVPAVMRRVARSPVLAASVSPPDADGYVSLGVSCGYIGSLVGSLPTFVEVNRQMPRTAGPVRIHLSETLGWCEADYPIPEFLPATGSAVDERIAELVAERVTDRATIQIGIGAIPKLIFRALRGHRDLGVHTELFSDGLMELVRLGVVTGAYKRHRPGASVTTFAMGSSELYHWLDGNAAVEFHAVHWVNSPRVVAEQDPFVSVNATTEVDLYGQCASETIAGRYYSGSGGQADFTRGTAMAEHGQGFIVLRSTTTDGTVSRIRATLTPGSVVTTDKNTVDMVVTEYGVACLWGQTLRARAHALIAIAHPAFRDELRADALRAGLI